MRNLNFDYLGGKREGTMYVGRVKRRQQTQKKNRCGIDPFVS